MMCREQEDTIKGVVVVLNQELEVHDEVNKEMNFFLFCE